MDVMTFSLGIIGADQFSDRFARPFRAHPGVSGVYVTDLIPERAERLATAEGLDGTFPDHEAMPESKAVDAVAVLTQRRPHGPLVLQGLSAGRHVHSAVAPMAPTGGGARRGRACVQDASATGPAGPAGRAGPWPYR
ncbi:hypothetical protein GCM10010377_42340 [Streptomyces viridiviolaceus]|nr:hypothetical protein GCM10010377_42340 [Streptomyces viridiviolaceus]